MLAIGIPQNSYGPT